tara:strand:- start:134 stop:331 length:198 start_codon:yes stop_codon:yes gene_type:complete
MNQIYFFVLNLINSAKRQKLDARKDNTLKEFINIFLLLTFFLIALGRISTYTNGEVAQLVRALDS